MSDEALDKLIFFISNPYIWLFVLFALSLERILIYIRRFYPKNLQEKMKKEEACMLEVNSNPKVVHLRKVFFFILLFFVLCSYVLAYYIFDYPSNKLLSMRVWDNEEAMFFILGFISFFFLLSVESFYESKLMGKKSCNEILVGNKFFTILNYIVLIPMLIWFIVMTVLLIRHHTVFNDTGIQFRGFYEWNSHSKSYTDISKIKFKNKCQNIEIYFKDNSIWDLKDYHELHYQGDRKKLVEFVSTKSNIEIEYKF